MAQKQTGKIAALLTGLVAVFAVLLIGINVVTGPIIAGNGASAAFAPLYAVMPDATGFDKLYDAADGTGADLKEIPGTVQSIYAETSGKGYAIRLSTTKGYTGNAIELTMAVDAEGKISGIKLEAYPESKDFGADYPGTFVGQDSALADVQVVAGCTYSSVAFRDAVSDGFAALIANDLVGAGVKGDDQLLMELLATAHSGLVNDKGVGQYEEQEGTGTYIQKVLKAKNNTGFAYLVKNGDAMLLAVVNASGSVKLLNTAGEDVTKDSANSGVVMEVATHAAANIVKATDKDQTRLNMLLADAQITEISLPDVFNSVSSAYELKKDGKTYYGLVSRSYGYANEVMGVYYVLDEQGAIVAMTADQLIFHAEYFNNYTLDEPSYKAGFAGLTADTWTGEQALISGATMTSDAVKTATNDIFAVFAALKGGTAQ